MYFCKLKACFGTLKVYFCTRDVHFCTLKVYFCNLKVYFCTLRVTFYSESVLVYFESILLYSESIFLNFEKYTVYFESILLYFATMLASGCIDNQCIKSKEKVVINIRFKDAFCCWGYHLRLLYLLPVHQLSDDNFTLILSTLNYFSFLQLFLLV